MYKTIDSCNCTYQKVSRRQNRTIAANRNNQIYIGKMLTIQLHSIDTVKVNIMMTQYSLQVIHAFSVRFVAALESVPPKGFGRLSPHTQLSVFFIGSLLYDYENLFIVRCGLG